MRRALVFLTLLPLFFLATNPLWAFNEVMATLDPPQPMTGEDFVVKIKGLAPPGVQFDSFKAYGYSELDILITKPHCSSNCPEDVPFELDIPVSGSQDGLRSGYITMAIWGDFTFPIVSSAKSKAYPDLLFSMHFGIGDLINHPLDPELKFIPSRPTDNDRLTLLLPFRRNSCSWFPGASSRVERDGNRLLVTMLPRAFYGACVISTIESDVAKVDLGQLEAGTYELSLFVDNEVQGMGTYSSPVQVKRTTFTIPDAPDQVTLRDGRFEARVEWIDPEGQMGAGRPVPDPTSESALFTFFNRENWELMIKILDGCDLNDHFWVFTAATTDVEHTIFVIDTLTGEQWISHNPPGTDTPAITDTRALPTCDAGTVM